MNTLSRVEDCDCGESGQSAVQSEAGGRGLRPILCALIKYNHFNPPRFNCLLAEAATSSVHPKRSTSAARHYFSVTQTGNTKKKF